jgi:hypothetical protein|tara:strand:+ start:14500 stop:14742 length:243 start_codon:yes stop_codon:yes gene_type:complete
MAGCTPADLHLVFCRWFEPKIRVERGYGPNIIYGGAREYSHDFQGSFRDIAQFVFYGKESRQHGNSRLCLTVDCVMNPLF